MTEDDDTCVSQGGWTLYCRALECYWGAAASWAAGPVYRTIPDGRGGHEAGDVPFKGSSSAGASPRWKLANCLTKFRPMTLMEPPPAASRGPACMAWQRRHSTRNHRTDPYCQGPWRGTHGARLGERLAMNRQT